ncbi:MAG: hypothetical protein PHF67_00960 [Candidatus Nanoarchaeia archaeon]|nr:hypothetical protein [Candidatus Nanoarchaeia archaeon]
MELKEPNSEYRIIFLKKFTEELIISFLKKEQIKKRIEIEKLRREFIEPKISPEQSFRKIIKTPVVPVKKSEPSTKMTSDIKKEYSRPLTRQTLYKFQPKKIKPKLKPIMPPIYPKEPAPLENFDFELKPRPVGFNLGKIDLLLKDPLIKMIECEGPEKELTIKKDGRTYSTKITLNQEEIKEILDSFSKEAKIPIIMGVFRAVVGDLMISALVSEVVGSKFIITKNSPYTLIEQKRKS